MTLCKALLRGMVDEKLVWNWLRIKNVSMSRMVLGEMLGCTAFRLYCTALVLTAAAIFVSFRVNVNAIWLLSTIFGFWVPPILLFILVSAISDSTSTGHMYLRSLLGDIEKLRFDIGIANDANLTYQCAKEWVDLRLVVLAKDVRRMQEYAREATTDDAIASYWVDRQASRAKLEELFASAHRFGLVEGREHYYRLADEEIKRESSAMRAMAGI